MLSYKNLSLAKNYEFGREGQSWPLLCYTYKKWKLGLLFLVFFLVRFRPEAIEPEPESKIWKPSLGLLGLKKYFKTEYMLVSGSNEL